MWSLSPPKLSCGNYAQSAALRQSTYLLAEVDADFTGREAAPRLRAARFVPVVPDDGPSFCWTVLLSSELDEELNAVCSDIVNKMKLA